MKEKRKEKTKIKSKANKQTKTEKVRGWDRSYSESMRDKLFCCAFK